MFKKLARLKGTTPTALTTGGLGWLAAAAWQWNDIAGTAATGVVLLVLGWLLED